MTYPVLQLALDFVDLDRALKAAREGVKGGVDWLEAGTPLIKSEGLEAVRRLKSEFPDRIIVADMKVMDAGRMEVECAAKAGADVVDVLGVAADATIEECVRAARNYGTKIVVDTIGIKSVKERAIQAEKMGADFVTVHTAIDEQMEGATPFGLLKEVASAINIPVGAAGGINSETVPEALKAGAGIVVVGGAITKSADARKAAEEIKRAMKTGKGIKTTLYRRVSLDKVRDVLGKVSTANISDAMHREGELKGVKPVLNDVKLVGTAVTVRTYPGDWAKPVEAIDRAGAGDVIVIDAGGAEPAVWGELATHSCVRKKISGVVIDGAIRDVEEVRKLKFPAFARVVTSAAGEPKGFGEIGVPVRIGGLIVHPGDWIVGDEDGVVVIPQKEVVEIANRAMDVLERENRIRKEIMDGGTLGGVTHLLRWEKRQ
jgi:3-hexulose-6-phosphate synthase/6-phospho-3-hexuloisomerase